MSNKNNNFDVIIVGGGLAGLSLSCLLGTQTNLKIACIDRDKPEDQIKADERTTAISYGSAQILKRAQIWDKLESKGCSIEDIEILDGESPVLLQFLSRDVENRSFGWIIPNRDIRTTLMQRMEDLPNVTHIAPEKVKEFAVSDNEASITCESGKTYTAKLIIGADGRQSSIREFMDVDVRHWNYKQRAVVCYIRHENPHNNKAVEHFWPAGPFAVLPMPDNEKGEHRSSLVFTEHTKRRSQSLMDLSDEEFHAKVAQKFPKSYGQIEIINNKRMAFPLTLSHAAEYIAPRMALVADAAHGIHPIAGQGLNLGFRDLGVITDLLQQVEVQGKDIGAQELLIAYQRKRRPDNMAMVAVTDALVRLFSNDLPPVKILRKAGLRAVGRLPAVKRFFMHRAMGE